MVATNSAVVDSVATPESEQAASLKPLRDCCHCLGRLLHRRVPFPWELRLAHHDGIAAADVDVGGDAAVASLDYDDRVAK